MPSAQSAWNALPTEARRELLDAVARVCDASLLAFTAPTSADMVAAIATEDVWFHAEVTFTGCCSGKVFLSIPHDLGFELFAALLRRIESAAKHDLSLADVIGGFAVRVCGTWLVALGAEAGSTVSDVHVTCGGLPAPEDDNLVMSLNDRPAVVRADLKAHATVRMPDATPTCLDQTARAATRPVTP